MPNVHTIAANRPFLDTLIEQLLDWDRERLADTLLLLPSRRACLAAREAFLRVGGGQALLLPRLAPISEPDEAELMVDPALELILPPAIGQVRRHLLLTRLVQAKNPTMPLEQAVRLAGELARFVDELHNEEVRLDGFETLVPAHLAVHWQQTLVSPAASRPELAVHSRGRGPARRHPPAPAAGRCADRQMAGPRPGPSGRGRRHYRQHPQRRPAAGTDRAAAGRHGRAAGARPDDRGCGLARGRATHPQYGLKQLVELMGVEPGGGRHLARERCCSTGRSARRAVEPSATACRHH